MRVGIDIDGVLTDVGEWQLLYGSKFFQKIPENPKAYEVGKAFSTTNEMDAEFWEKYLFKYAAECVARPLAEEITHRIHGRKHKIYIITARAKSLEKTPEGRAMKKIVKKWLKKHNIYYDKLIFTKEDKLEACLKYKIDVMIEDKPENILQLSEFLPVIKFTCPYNQKISGKNILSAHSWSDIEILISQIEKEKLDKKLFV